jgi:hypothetical protein
MRSTSPHRCILNAAIVTALLLLSACGRSQLLTGACAYSIDCPADQVCQDGYCAPRPVDTGDCDPPCSAQGSICQNGACVPIADPECSDTQPCPVPLLCVKSFCQLDEPVDFGSADFAEPFRRPIVDLGGFDDPVDLAMPTCPTCPVRAACTDPQVACVALACNQPGALPCPRSKTRNGRRMRSILSCWQNWRRKNSSLRRKRTRRRSFAA